MSNLIDIIGLDKMLKYIRSTGKTKFSIYRAGQSGNNIPVYECFEHNTAENAVQSFQAWAEVIDNNAVYKIVLTDNVDIDADGTVKKSKNKSGKMEALFALNAPGVQYGQQQQQQSGQLLPAPLDAAEMRKQITAEIVAAQREDTLMRKVDELTVKIAAMEAEEEEEEEGGLMGVLGNPQQMAQINSLLMMLRGGPAAQVPGTGPLAGPAEQTPQPAANVHPRPKEQRTENVNNALKRLYKANRDIDTDLLLLADLAENKPETFNQMLMMLRGGMI